MAEAKMSDACSAYDSSLWLMDGSDVEYPADFKDLEPLPKELKKKFDALFDEIFEIDSKIKSAA